MNTFKILFLCLFCGVGFAQNKVSKTTQNINVNKDVVVDLNTNYVQIEIDTWNKDEIAIDAFLESEQLSEVELKQILKDWNLNIDATLDNVVISSKGGAHRINFNTESYGAILQDLELNLADLPEMPEVFVMRNMPNLSDFPELPELPEMPVFPKLPELPKGVSTIKFDYDKYKDEGESYLKKWSQKYEKKGGKELQKRMEEWARKFAESDYEEKMKKWGEDYGKRFEGKWAEELENWSKNFGENYGKDMEKWAESFGKNFSKDWEEKMEAWGKRFEARMKGNNKNLENQSKDAELQAKVMQKRAKLMEKRVEKMARIKEKRDKKISERHNAINNRRDIFLAKRKRLERGYNSNVKRIIKITIPKNAKLKLNVRHGELKVASLLNNVTGDVSHTFLVAEHIDGSDTSINVSYSPVVINKWNLGTLNLNFVDKAQIKYATDLVLNSKSSNISIDNLTNTGIIDGSFGDLTISNLAETFKNLNLVLENSDALISLPQKADYKLFFKGNRSKYNNEPTTQKTIKKNDNGQSIDKTIIVNAKFSNVIVN